MLVVRDFDELEARATEATGRIVVFAPPWESYGANVQYRVHGASLSDNLTFMRGIDKIAETTKTKITNTLIHPLPLILVDGSEVRRHVLWVVAPTNLAIGSDLI